MADDIRFSVLSNRCTGEIQGQIRGLAYDVVRDVCEDALVDVRRRMHEPGRGRIYVHGGISHQSSAPGQAPAAETGALIASYEVGVAMTPIGPVGIVGSDSPYAGPLEYGTARVAPRPALTPAMQTATSKLESKIAAAYLRSLE